VLSYHCVSLLGFYIYIGQGSHQMPTPEEHGVVGASVLFCANIIPMSSGSELFL
jgi:hypothetical protein